MIIYTGKVIAPLISNWIKRRWSHITVYIYRCSVSSLTLHWPGAPGVIRLNKFTSSKNQVSSNPVKKRSCGLWTLVEPSPALGPAGVMLHSRHVRTMGMTGKLPIIQLGRVTHYSKMVTYALKAKSVLSVCPPMGCTHTADTWALLFILQLGMCTRTHLTQARYKKQWPLWRVTRGTTFFIVFNWTTGSLSEPSQTQKLMKFMSLVLWWGVVKNK